MTGENWWEERVLFLFGECCIDPQNTLILQLKKKNAKKWSGLSARSVG